MRSNHSTAARLAASIARMGKVDINPARVGDLWALGSASTKPGRMVKPGESYQPQQRYHVQLGMDGVREAQKIYGE